MQDVNLKQFPDQSFTDEMHILPLNEAFYNAIKKIRPKFGIKRENDIWDDKRPECKENWIKIYEDFSSHLKYIEPIVNKCRLGKGKYKEAMRQTVLSIVLFDDPFIPWQFQEYSLETLPKLKTTVDKSAMTINLSLEIYGDTNLSDVVKVIKKNWSDIIGCQKIIKMKKIRPLTILHLSRGIHLLRQDLKAREIYNQIPVDLSDKNQIQPATIYKEQERINKRIADAFLDI